MQRHRVLVLYRQSLFAQGLQRLLEKSGDFEVIGADLDVQDGGSLLRSLGPDVVVADYEDLSASRGLLVQLLRETPSVKVVCLTALDGKVNLYRREPTAVTRSDELLRALLSP